VATSAGLGVARREFRALVAACILGVGAAGIASSQSALGLDPAVVGLAFVAFVAGAAIRLGSIPFHLWVARAADTAPPVGLPLVMAWAPAGFVAVTLAWLNTSILPLEESLSIERAVILLVAATTIVLASAAATLHADLEHIVGYSIVADGAVALLGLAVLDPGAWGSTRTWLITFALAKTGFAAWVAAIHYSFGARQLGELDGWARRSPVLGLALLAVFVASIGLPGMTNLDARLDLVGLALPQPLAAGLLVLSLISLGYYIRLAITGLRSPSAAVASGPDPIPRIRRSPRPPGSRAPRGAPAQVAATVAILRENRAPIAAGLVLAMSGLAVIVAIGGFGIEEAAAAARPVPLLPLGFGQDSLVSATPTP
jgi:NADH:ubiquinone oxidoreductase subunit 2 (subunit N)